MPLNFRYLPILNDGRDAPLMEMDVRDMTGGMNTKLHPTAIADDEAVLLENVLLGQGGLAQRRSGTTNVMSGQTPTGPFIGLGRWNPPTTPQEERLIATAQGGIYDWDGSSTWRALTGGSFSGTEPVYFIQGAEIQPVYDTLGWFFQRGASSVYQYDGTSTLTTVSGAGSGLANSVPTGVDADFWLGRLWVAEDGENNGYIRYSLFGEPTKFDLSEGFLVNPNDDVMRIRQWFNTGIIIFQRNSIWALDIDQANFDTLTFDSTRMEMLNSDIGCVAGKTVAQSGQDFFFLSRHGVMQLSKTERDRAVGRSKALSDPINPLIDTINWSAVESSRGVVWDRWYLCAIPTGTSTKPDTVLAWDIWEQAWTTFSGWDVGDFEITEFPSEEQKLYFATSAVSSEVYEALDDNATTDDGVGITGTVETPRYDFGTTDKRKTFRYISVATDALSGGTLTVYAAPDNQDFTRLGVSEIDAGQLTLNFVLDPVNPPVLGGNVLQIDRFDLDQFEDAAEMQFKFEITAEQGKVLFFTLVGQPWAARWS